MERNKIVITGACGHIGSALIRSLEGVDILAVDNFLTQRYTSLFNLDSHITFFEGNFLDVDLPEGCTVLHFAAITDAASSMKNSSQVEEININQTKAFIDKCIESKVARFIFPSSTSVYGTASDVVNEDDPAYENPQSPYAQSKLEVEKYLESKKDQLKYLVPRFGTIFGYSAGMRFHTAINKFCWQAATNQPITIWEDNYHQVRPYLGLQDAVRAVEHFITLEDSQFNTKYNVLTGNYKLSSIVEGIKKQVPGLKVEMVKTPLLNQFSYDVDDTKVRNTGYTPQDDIEQEIASTLNLLRNLY